MRCSRSVVSNWVGRATVILAAAIASSAQVVALPHFDKPHQNKTIVNDAALSDGANTSDWLAYGRTYDGQRFSPLNQINALNVDKLGVDWFLDLPDERGGIVSTPLIVDGVIYFRTSRDFVYAADAVTGRLLWTYDPKIGDLMGDPNRHPQLWYLHGGRGLAFWHDKLYTATVDGRLVALEPRSGKEIWHVQVYEPDTAQYVVGAPIAFHGKVLVGFAGTEFGLIKNGKARMNRGYVTAYDAETGKQAWRFYTVPGDPSKPFENKAMAMASKTWPKDFWKRNGGGGGGHAWGEGFSYDAEQNILFIGTGNAGPVPRKNRGPGDALFTDSIIAVDADTGEYRWHYQLNPSEQWGWDAITPLVQATLQINGQPVKVLMLAPKNGFFYVINRTTGKLISAEPYTKQNWASKIDLASGRPVELPSADYSILGKAVVWPGAAGPRSWEAISYNPQTGLAYIPSHNDGTLMQLDDEARPIKEFILFAGYDMMPSGEPIKGKLQAWDPVQQKSVWEVPMPGPIGPGTLTTGGNLVFHGQADGQLVAFDATKGTELWHYSLGLGLTAPPVTYSIKGRQYVAQLVGYGSSHTGYPEAVKMGWSYGRGTRRLVVFSLDGKATVPAQPAPQVPQPSSCPNFKVDPALAEKGANLFGACFLCHTGSLAPNLPASQVPCDASAFKATVHYGRPAVRMPPFPSMTDEDLTALQHFIRSLAEEKLATSAQPDNAAK